MNEFKIGDEVYFMPSYGYKGEKIYGIIRHIGKLPSTTRHYSFIREIGEDGCVWSEWDNEWNGQINPESLGWMPKEKVYRACKEEKMSEFKVGDRVKWHEEYGNIVEIYRDQIWIKWDMRNRTWVSEKDWINLGFKVIREGKISKYEELKERIKNLQNGWDKEADDILQEITKREYYHLDITCGNNYSEAMYIDVKASGDECIRFDFDNQCSKLEAFKKALLWLLDHSDIKKDEKEEKIKELEMKANCIKDQYERDLEKLQEQIKELKND